MMKKALEYATQLQWRVIPVHGVTRQRHCTCSRGAMCRSAGKHPAISQWVRRASTDPIAIESWPWDKEYNVGVVPTDFCILDFDGQIGIQTLKSLLRVLPALPDGTPIARTGSGGLHLYIDGTAPTAAGILPHVDVRGVGGQAVLPPSRHHSGGSYEWLHPPVARPPSAPEWLAVARQESPIVKQINNPVTKEDIKKLSKNKNLKDVVKCLLTGKPFASVGTRNSTLWSLASALVRRHPFADPEQVADFFQPSLDAMSSQKGPPTREELVSMLHRAQKIRQEELKQKPRICVSTDIEKMSGLAVTALRESEIEIYSRAGSLVTVRAPEGLPDGVLRDEVPPAFSEVCHPNLLAYLASSAEWYRCTADDEKMTTPPSTVVSYVLNRGYWDLPHAERITAGPHLRPDGSLFPGGGYDESTGIISVGSADRTPLLSSDEALEQLLQVVVDFPFQAEAHQSAWLAALLTCASQQLFRGPSPLFLIDANAAAVGKTLLAEVTIYIATGRSPYRATLGCDSVEDRKQITTAAIAGAQTIFIDNISGKFGTPTLCEALTLSDSCWTDRVLGESKSWTGALKPTWLGTGNNIVLREDMSRRVCYVRLDCPAENPERRGNFQNPALLAWVAEDRAALYRAVLSILHHYIQDGKPQKDLSEWGKYENWSELIRQAVVWLGLPDPILTQEDLSSADEEKEILRKLLVGLFELQLEEITPTKAHTAVYSTGNMLEYTTLRDALESGCVQKGPLPTPQSIGKLFAYYRGRVAGSLRLEKLKKQGSHWKVVEVDK